MKNKKAIIFFASFLFLAVFGVQQFAVAADQNTLADMTAQIQSAGSYEKCTTYCSSVGFVNDCANKCAQEYDATSIKAGNASGNAYACDDPNYITNPSNPSECIPDCKKTNGANSYYSSYYDDCVGGTGAACLNSNECGGGYSCNSSNQCVKNIWGSMFGGSDPTTSGGDGAVASETAGSGGSGSSAGGLPTYAGGGSGGKLPTYAGSGLAYSSSEVFSGSSSGSKCDAARFTEIGGICYPIDTGLSTAPIGDIITNVLDWLMGIFVTLSVLAFVYSGVQYLVSRGDAKETENAKNTAKYAAMGIVVGLSGMIVVQAIARLISGTTTFF